MPGALLDNSFDIQRHLVPNVAAKDAVQIIVLVEHQDVAATLAARAFAGGRQQALIHDADRPCCDPTLVPNALAPTGG